MTISQTIKPPEMPWHAPYIVQIGANRLTVGRFRTWVGAAFCLALIDETCPGNPIRGMILAQ